MVNLHIIPMKDLFFTLSSEITEVEQSKLFSQNDRKSLAKLLSEQLGICLTMIDSFLLGYSFLVINLEE